MRRTLVGERASERLEERGIMEWRGSIGHKTMQIAGKRTKRTRLVQTEKYVVSGEVEMAIPPDDSSEPCDEPQRVEFLREVKQHAEHGDAKWLSRHGKVYAALEAA
jgi:hypothetical protein